MYLNYQPKHGYNSYIDAAADDLGTQMDVGLSFWSPVSNIRSPSRKRNAPCCSGKAPRSCTMAGRARIFPAPTASAPRATACLPRAGRISASAPRRIRNSISRKPETRARMPRCSIRRRLCRSSIRAATASCWEPCSVRSRRISISTTRRFPIWFWARC